MTAVMAVACGRENRSWRTSGCTQPQCTVRNREVDSRFLAELLVGLMAGEAVREELNPSSRIRPHARCVECVERVMRGQPPLKTVAELLRLDEAGHWTHRRQRRQRRRDSRE